MESRIGQKRCACGRFKSTQAEQCKSCSVSPLDAAIGVIAFLTRVGDAVVRDPFAACAFPYGCGTDSPATGCEGRCTVYDNQRRKRLVAVA